MKLLTRRNGSQRSSQPKRIATFETMPRNDGATVYPILWFLVGDVWNGIEFENEGEARVLLSEAQHIFRSFGG